jgi:hypothetical protein
LNAKPQKVQPLPILDLARLQENAEELAITYRGARPFGHVVLDDFLEPDAARRAMEELSPLDEETWNSYVHINERKFSHTEPTSWGPTLQSILDELNSCEFVSFLEGLTGIDNLFADPSLEGGGLHQSTTGGYLNIHADFTVHPHHRNWRRRVNLLLYLNEDWHPGYGGDLELWTTDMKRREKVIAPLGNRTVIFTTDADSFHGHPEPMTCPPGVARRSLALYYFSLEDQPLVRSTEYRARPGDGVHSAMIYADKQLLRAYDWAKRRLGLSDDAAFKILGYVERFRKKNPPN